MCFIVSGCYFYIVGICNVVKGTSHLPDVSVCQLLRLQGNGHWSTVTGVAGGLGVGTGGVTGGLGCGCVWCCAVCVCVCVCVCT